MDVPKTTSKKCEECLQSVNEVIFKCSEETIVSSKILYNVSHKIKAECFDLTQAPINLSISLKKHDVDQKLDLARNSKFAALCQEENTLEKELLRKKKYLTQEINKMKEEQMKMLQYITNSLQALESLQKLSLDETQLTFNS